MSPRVGLVLGAGGVTGQAYHLGVLSALADIGFDGRSADVLVGTSAGSLVAAGLAAGLSAGDLAAELLGEPPSAEGARLREAGRARAVPRLPAEAAEAVPRRGPLAPYAVLAAARRPWAVRPAAVVAGLLPAGGTSTMPISRGVQSLFERDWPERDLRVAAVQVADGRRVMFGSPGAPAVDVGTAVAASCAVPGYFSPVVVANQTFVDGGAHSPSNADALLADRLDVVVVLSPMSLRHWLPRKASLDLGLRYAVRGYLYGEVRRLRRAGARVVVLQPGPAELAVMGLHPLRMHRVEEVLEAAAAATRARLASGLADALGGL